MIGRLFGAGTPAALLRAGLGESSASLRMIAHRVANATTPGGPGGRAIDAAGAQGAEAFADALDGAAAPAAPAPVDIESEMVRLADEQIRFDASATLLQRVYAQIRASVKGA